MTQQPRGSGSPDLVGEFQRWLVRSGARGVTRQLGGQIRGVLGRGDARDVWETATAPPPPEGSSDCAWCPVCRAARLLRESGPGFASHVTTAQDVLSSVVQEAMTMVESALANAGRLAEQGPGRDTGPGTRHGGDAGAQAGAAGGDAGTGGPAPAREEAVAGADGIWAQAALAPDPGDEADAAGPPGSPSREPDDRD